MKKNIIIILFTGLSLVLPTACLKEYLDKAPEQGLTDQQVFSKYDNFKLYFDAVYEGTKKGPDNNSYDWNIKNAFPLFFSFWTQKFTWDTMTDAADRGRGGSDIVKIGNLTTAISQFTYDVQRRPILGSAFTCIRICNRAQSNIHYLKESGVDQVEIDDLLGQIHFVRAFCHFELFRIWGRMPYIVKEIGPYDQWDIPRLSKHETLIKIAADFDSAAFFFNAAGRMRRDPGPGLPGHLQNADQKRPNGVAAKAYKGRALLYAASPLNNELGAVDWQNAAVANWEALQLALANNYSLLPASTMKQNFVGASYTNEELWAWTAGMQTWNSVNFQSIMANIFNGGAGGYSGICPTQNFVDKYETSFGEPLNTQADRNTATAATHYNEQNPYINRDSRFYQDIIYNQSPTLPGWTNNSAQIYYQVIAGKTVYSELLPRNITGITFTGYYGRKYSNGNSTKYTASFIVTDPLYRLAELYLNYAEAANEAYGPNTPAPGASLTAVQALNVVRTRALQPNVLAAFTGSTDALRPRIKNEQCVEFAYEGHYYHDLRRWMDAPVAYAGPQIGMDIEKLAPGYNVTTYPIGFRHTRLPLPTGRQILWKDEMYYFPFTPEDNFKMKNFVPNVVW